MQAWCTKLLVVCERLLVGWPWCANMVLLSSFAIPVWWEIGSLAWWLSMLVFSVWCEVSVKISAGFGLPCPWCDNIEEFSTPAALLMIWCETMLLKKRCCSPVTTSQMVAVVVN